MAGPAASVCVRFDASVPTWRELLVPYATKWYDGESCGIADTAHFGGSYSGEERPFVGSVDPFTFDANEFPDDAAIADAIRRCTRREWTHSIVVAAMCNQFADHQILCELAIAIAEDCDGIIDFDCLEIPPDSSLRRCTWVFESEEQWTTIGSADDAREWLRHPEFRMLK